MEELPGYIDVQIVFSNGEVVKEGRKFAYSICHCEPAAPSDIAILDSIAEREVEEAKHAADSSVDELQDLL